MLLEFLSERKYFGYISIGLLFILILLSYFKIFFILQLFIALCLITYLIFVTKAYNQYSVLNHKFFKEGDMEGYDRGKKEGLKEGRINGHREAIKDYYGKTDEKEKQLDIIIRGIPVNKHDECKEFLELFLELNKVPDSKIKQNNTEKSDELNMQFMTIASINDLRQRLCKEFPITVSPNKTNVLEDFLSMDATGSGKIKIQVEGNATKGTMITFDQDLTKTEIIADNYDKWRAEIVINLTPQIIQQGYIVGTAVKDNMTKRIKAQIGI